MAEITVRDVAPADIDVLLDFIRLLGVHEKRPEAVTVTADKLHDLMFADHPIAYGILGFLDGKPVAYAMLCQKYSSFRGTKVAYIEDLLVTDAARGHGFGKHMMAAIAEKSLDWGCDALEWSALDYNDEALGFYDYLGAERETNRVHFDFDSSQLAELASVRT